MKPFLQPAGRPRVKICGITRERDARDAIELGAHALGFNLYPRSKRYVDLKNEAGWIGALPPHITKVAVMVNPSLAEAGEVFALPYIDMVQFHGDEDAGFCAHIAGLGLPFIKAVAVKDDSALRSLDGYYTRHILLDAWSPDAYGGTGKTIAPEVLRQLAADADGLQLILAGGLNPDNVRTAIDWARPHAVDVASGVESAPGLKDRGLMEAFIRAAA
ncbi:MAG TPA: phosphoribosylanthranilate isomerase [Chthoniobacteraceae bacterium]|nr:phosphoribosylanthranilate isomerase [Chthoniobacteraceae bacterium]